MMCNAVEGNEGQTPSIVTSTKLGHNNAEF